MTTEVIPSALGGERVDRVVSMLFGLARREAADLVASGGVTIAGRAVVTRSSRVREGDVLDVVVPEGAGPEAAPAPGTGLVFSVVHADEQVVVVDKPAGLVVHPGAGQPSGTLVNGLLQRFPDMAGIGDVQRPGIVHRLDSGTSGLLVAARTEAAYRSLVEQLGARTVERVYVALVWGHFETTSGVVDAPVGRSAARRTLMAVTADGRPARTSFEVRDQFETPGQTSLVECRLETGRTHQIRVHMAAVGHPVVGDARYGGARSAISTSRPFLHARELAFDHPGTGERARFSSPLPPELDQVLGPLS